MSTAQTYFRSTRKLWVWVEEKGYRTTAAHAGKKWSLLHFPEIVFLFLQI